MLAISLVTGLPVQTPSASSAMAIGMHYLYPFVGVALFFSLASLFGIKRHLAVVVVALLAYAIVLWAHFNVKLWPHYLNPNSFDAFYWMTDQWIRPLIDLCIGETEWLVSLHPLMGNFCVLSFILLFVTSFTVHAIMDLAAINRIDHVIRHFDAGYLAIRPRDDRRGRQADITQTNDTYFRPLVAVHMIRLHNS